MVSYCWIGGARWSVKRIDSGWRELVRPRLHVHVGLQKNQGGTRVGSQRAVWVDRWKVMDSRTLER